MKSKIKVQFRKFDAVGFPHTDRGCTLKKRTFTVDTVNFPRFMDAQEFALTLAIAGNSTISITSSGSVVAFIQPSGITTIYRR